jgi:dTDP-4-amino-4,6-dideoxygalactose transaminase
MIPFVDLSAQYRSIKADIDAAIQGVIDSTAFIRGPAVARFEQAFAALHGVKHAVAVASGTDALHLAVRALDLGPGDEVITVPNTWISTAFAASYVGARPVLVDIDRGTYQMDAAALERAITPRTKAVIPVHMFGHPAPMDRIMALCRPRGIKVIEDVAQAPLAELYGRRVGTFGDIACFSFYPSKNLGCYGDGGAVISDDDALGRRLREYADYGQTTRYHHVRVGYNSRLDTMQAAILLAKLPHLESWTRARRENASRYDEKLKGFPIKRPSEAPGARAVYHLYVIEVDRRDECLRFLRDRGVMAQVHYPGLVHLQPCYQELGYRIGDFPVAEAAIPRILSLPMYAELTASQTDTVVEALATFLGR